MPDSVEKKLSKKRKTFELRLTKFELIHLRDLFSVGLPPDLKQTISQALAALEDRTYVEAKFWQKIVSLCSEAELPLDADAPDFVVAASAAPPCGVFKLASEPNESDEEAEDNSESDEGRVFGVETKDKSVCNSCHECGSRHRTMKHDEEE